MSLGRAITAAMQDQRARDWVALTLATGWARLADVFGVAVLAYGFEGL
jgi:hypothetical protein